MTEILTWNIQCGLGVDGRVDLDRIAQVIRAMGDPDAICLQEVSRYMPPFGTESEQDQVEALSALFPSHTPYFGAAIDRSDPEGGQRQAFGNLTLSRLPALSVFQHPLPQPAQVGIRHMPRQAVETTLQTLAGPLRVVTTHLEYHSLEQRHAQVERLRALHAEACANLNEPGDPSVGSPYEPVARPEASLICGDFNFEPDSAEYRAMTASFDGAQPVADFIDVWRHIHGSKAHDATCGIFDSRQWPAGAHCRDFFFASAPLTHRLESIAVNTKTDASDHQPVLLVLSD